MINEVRCPHCKKEFDADKEKRYLFLVEYSTSVPSDYGSLIVVDKECLVISENSAEAMLKVRQAVVDFSGFYIKSITELAYVGNKQIEVLL